MSKTVTTRYQPEEHESSTYRLWEEAGAFSPIEKSDQQPFVIMLPPPNITGKLHIGHALQDTIMDTLVRYHRMQGKPVLWLPGTDSAAIATNRVIENQLQEEGLTRQEIGRQAFMKRVDAWYEKTGADIINQMKRLGCSCDWSRLRFTMDEDYVEAVNEAFIRYYNAGYIYRGARIVNWDPASKTTVSDLEIDYQTEKAPFYYLQYGPFEIGTARPETKFGDKYVVVHPDDKRYAQYKHGDTFTAEWINGPIEATIIKDKAADPALGTGAMTITPWHSAVDFEIAQRHNLDLEQIIDFDGKLLPIAGEFAGLSISEARPGIVEKLTAKGLLTRVDESYEHNIALNDRGKGIIEPQVMRQWFIRMDKLKGDAIKAATKESVRFIPGRWKNHFTAWLENVYDWNINRQIWLGHRLPVWWQPGTHGTAHEEGSFTVAREKPAGDWVQDPDVLDTWFATALWPFAALGWPQSDTDLKRFYPSSVLVTARDILYLWVARMVFSGLKFINDIPFRNVFIHPTVLAKDGRRMSKSLGTGIDPLELIDQFGADATRFGLMTQLNYDSQAIKFDERDIKTARNFANKIWNISRLLENLPADQKKKSNPTLADRWIIDELNYLIKEITNHLENYRIGETARRLVEFIWQDFADWYLEILKTDGTPRVAREVFVQLLKLLHPLMPHVTETLYQHTYRNEAEPLLINAAWPGSALKPSASIKKNLDQFKAVVRAVRSARALLNIPASETINLYSDAEIPLPAAVKRMCRAEIISKSAESMARFPLTDRFISLSSPSINDASIARARQKLMAEIADLNRLIEKIQLIIKQMRGKAEPDKVKAKEAELSQLQSRLSATHRSLEYL